MENCGQASSSQVVLLQIQVHQRSIFDQPTTQQDGPLVTNTVVGDIQVRYPLVALQRVG